MLTLRVRFLRDAPLIPLRFRFGGEGELDPFGCLDSGQVITLFDVEPRGQLHRDSRFESSNCPFVTPPVAHVFNRVVTKNARTPGRDSLKSAPFAWVMIAGIAGACLP